MKYEKIAEYSNAKFRRITGVKRATFEKMAEILRKGYAEKHRHRGRKPKLSIEDLLLAALEYLREYRTYAHIAASYGIAESNRPLAKLNKAVKIADACDKGKAKSKTFSAVTVSLGKDTKSFDKTDSVFDENSFS